MSALGLAALIINSVLTCCCSLPHWLLEFCIHCLISLCSFHLLLFSPFEYIESLRLPRCFTSWGTYVKSSGLQAICCCDIAAPAFLVLPQSLCSCPAWALSAVLQCAKLFLVPFLVCQNIFCFPLETNFRGNLFLPVSRMSLVLSQYNSLARVMW